MVVAPCKNCEKRYVGCHGTCEEYLKYRIDLEKEKKMIKLEKERKEYVTYDKLQRSRGFMLFSQV